MKLTFQSVLQTIRLIIDQLLPAQCLLCRLASNNKLICEYCQKTLMIKRPCCQRCGLSLPAYQAFCGDCLQQSHLFTQLHAVADYHPPYPYLIKRFKYAKQLIYGELLSELLTQSVLLNISNRQLAEINYLLPIPLYKQKHRQRGFNQAQILAGALAKKLQIPLLLEAVERHKQTKAQEGLSLQKRKKNLKGAFSITRNQQNKLPGSYIVIIDDVVTTGATVNSLCSVLLQAGVKRIDVWCICRTALPTQKKQ